MHLRLGPDRTTSRGTLPWLTPNFLYTSTLLLCHYELSFIFRVYPPTILTML